jgi:hypothetical protein
MDGSGDMVHRMLRWIRDDEAPRRRYRGHLVSFCLWQLDLIKQFLQWTA